MASRPGHLTDDEVVVLCQHDHAVVLSEGGRCRHRAREEVTRRAALVKGRRPETDKPRADWWVGGGSNEEQVKRAADNAPEASVCHPAQTQPQTLS
jgi:hypothetical protein